MIIKLQWIIFIGVCCALAIGATGFCASEWLQKKALVSRGARADGALDENYTEHRKSGAVTYSVTYRFRIDGKDYSGSTTSHDRPTNRAVKVVYLPEDPSVNSISPGDSESQAGQITFMMGALSVLGLVCWLSIFLRWRSARRTAKLQPGR